MLDMELFRSRLKEAFGADTQKMVAEKLHTTQGNVSKWLSSPQQPELDTLYNISETYKVSVDWLLGLSEQKRIMKSSSKTTYALLAEALCDLRWHQAAEINDGLRPKGHIFMEIKDPLLNMLIDKGFKLISTDRDIYEEWVETRLSLFEDAELIWNSIWGEDDINFLANEARTESNWREVHHAAVEQEDFFDMIMGDDAGPFAN